MLSSLYQDPEYRQKIAGLAIAGVAPVSRITQKILDGTGIPYLRTSASSSATLAAINEDVAKITAEDEEKIASPRPRASGNSNSPPSRRLSLSGGTAAWPSASAEKQKGDRLRQTRPPSHHVPISRAKPETG